MTRRDAQEVSIRSQGASNVDGVECPSGPRLLPCDDTRADPRALLFRIVADCAEVLCTGFLQWNKLQTLRSMSADVDADFALCFHGQMDSTSNGRGARGLSPVALRRTRWRRNDGNTHDSV